MMRLIDADALISSHPTICSRDMKFNLDLAPTIDAVEVVRCKDCKGYLPAICTCKTKQITMGENAFCSFGEHV